MSLWLKRTCLNPSTRLWKISVTKGSANSLKKWLVPKYTPVGILVSESEVKLSAFLVSMKNVQGKIQIWVIRLLKTTAISALLKDLEQPRVLGAVADTFSISSVFRRGMKLSGSLLEFFSTSAFVRSVKSGLLFPNRTLFPKESTRIRTCFKISRRWP